MSANIKASVDGTQAIIGVGGVDQMTVSNAGVVTANSFVGNVTATGSSTARTLANRFADVVNVLDFGADPTGVVDSTQAFIDANATGSEVLVPKGTYILKNTIPIYGKLRGVLGQSIINLTIDNAEGLGFWLQPNSSIEGLTINRNVSVAPVNGARGNAIFAGEYSGGTPIAGNTGKLYENIVIRDIEINATGIKWNTISLIGNVAHFQVQNIWIDGIILIPILCHWTKTTSNVSYHPRNGSIKNIHITSASNYFDNVDYGGVYLSACHDISIENTYAENCSRGPVIASGDIGNYYASPESKGRVLTNILCKNIAVKNWKNEGFWIVGRSAEISAGIRSIANVDGMSVSLENITMQRGADSTSAEGLIVRFVSNVQVKNIQIFNVDGEQQTLTGVPGVSITAANNISIQGGIRVPQAIEVVSGNGIELDVDLNWNATNYGSASYVGLLIDGTEETATTSSVVNINGTSITLASIPCDIYPEMEFTQGGNRFYFTGAAVSGDANVTIGILPAIAAIASSAIITIENGANNLVVKDSKISGYYYNVRLSSTTHLVPKDISFTDCAFFDNGLRHILCQSASNITVQNCSFEKGNQLNNASGNDISVLGTTQNLIVSGNSFSQNSDSLSKYCVNVGPSVDGIIISNNNFYKAVTGAINLDDFGGSFDNVIATNYFASGITTRISGSRSATTIAGNIVGYAAAAPTTGTFKQGDIFFNTGATSAGFAGWICTVAGTPGTWKTFGVIS
jgi:hypothetical protein